MFSVTVRLDPQEFHYNPLGTMHGGIISTLSCQWRGWSRDKQRSVFQPVLFAAFVIISISQLIAGSYTLETVKLYGIGLPFMVAGIWIGFKLYGTINDEIFRKAVLILVLLAGLSLIVSAAGLMPVGSAPALTR